MPRCNICSHDARGEIEGLLIGGATHQSVADTYGFSRASVTRHKNNHMTEIEVEVVDSPEVQTAIDEQRDAIVAQIGNVPALQRRWQMLVEAHDESIRKARESGNQSQEIAALREARIMTTDEMNLTLKIMEVELKKREQDRADAQAPAALYESEEWHLVRDTILGALRTHPMALRAVTTALKKRDDRTPDMEPNTPYGRTPDGKEVIKRVFAGIQNRELRSKLYKVLRDFVENLPLPETGNPVTKPQVAERLGITPGLNTARILG